MEDLGEPDLEGAVDEIEGVLDRDDAGKAHRLGGLEEGHHAPWRLVGEADEPDLALLYELAEHAENDLDGMALALLVHIVEALEDAHRPVRPMKLIEVDIVGLEPLEAPVQRLDKLRPALPPGRAVLAQPGHFRAADGLGGDHHFVAGFMRGKPGADDGFGAPLRLGLGRDGVDLGGVEHIDAAVERVVHLGVAFGLAVLLAEGHGAK